MRVFLADDQVSLRSALRLLLEHEANVEVVGESGNIRTLPLFVHNLRPDLLFLDWQLSGLDTDSAHRLLVDTVRAIDPLLYIIALTTNDNAERCILLGANAVVNKAEPPERLLSVLHEAVHRKLNHRGQRADGHQLL